MVDYTNPTPSLSNVTNGARQFTVYTSLVTERVPTYDINI